LKSVDEGFHRLGIPETLKMDVGSHLPNTFLEGRSNGRWGKREWVKGHLKALGGGGGFRGKGSVGNDPEK